MRQGQLSAVVRYLRQVAGTPLSGEISDADLLTRFSTGRDEAARSATLEAEGRETTGQGSARAKASRTRRNGCRPRGPTRRRRRTTCVRGR